jgi:hypothetical protein
MAQLVQVADSVKPKALNKEKKIKLAQDSIEELQVIHT